MNNKNKTLKETFVLALENYKKKITKMLKFIAIKYLALIPIILIQCQC